MCLLLSVNALDKLTRSQKFEIVLLRIGGNLCFGQRLEKARRAFTGVRRNTREQCAPRASATTGWGGSRYNATASNGVVTVWLLQLLTAVGAKGTADAACSSRCASASRKKLPRANGRRGFELLASAFVGVSPAAHAGRFTSSRGAARRLGFERSRLLHPVPNPLQHNRACAANVEVAVRAQYGIISGRGCPPLRHRLHVK